MPAPRIIGNPWGSRSTWDTDTGPMSFQGYDAGYQINTAETPTDGWFGVHVTDDPNGEEDVIAINGKRFREIPGQ